MSTARWTAFRDIGWALFGAGVFLLVAPFLMRFMAWWFKIIGFQP